MTAVTGFTHSLAVVIGIDAYGRGIPPLRTATNDAHRLAELLRADHGYETILLTGEATGQPVTGARLGMLFKEELAARLDEDDRLLVYFAGHGIALDGDDGPAGYLVPQDARPDIPSSLLAMTDLHRWLTDLPCRHMLAILDCCFAGAFRWASTRHIGALPEVIHKERFDRYLRSPAWQVITSASYDQKALDVLTGSVANSVGTRHEDGRQHSPFAQALFDALKGAGDLVPKGHGDGVITASELTLYLRQAVEVAVAERADMEQTPQLWPLNKHRKGEFIFLVPGHPLNLPSAEALTEQNNPYRGLRPYEREHRDLFFGRQEEIEALCALLAGQPFVAVLGASGTGKSSLVKAGLLPRLKDAGEQWRVLPPIRPTDHPVQALAVLLQGSLPGIPVALDADDGLAQAVAGWQAVNPQMRLVLTVDQCEELITLCRDEQERTHFLTLLAATVRQHPNVFRLIITLRTDFEPQLAGSALFTDHGSRFMRYVIPPMDQADLRDVIEGPASVRVLYFEPSELVDELINEVVQMPGALPLLSFTLSEMFTRYVRSGRDDRALTLADYQAVGGVIGSLRQRANEEYDCLPDDAHRATMQRVMLRMVSVEGGGELARRRVMVSELDYPTDAENTRVRTVLDRLIEARLLVRGSVDVDEHGTTEPYVEPAHDALARAWDKLRLWQQANAETLPLQRRLTMAGVEWNHAGNDAKKSLLWDNDPRLPILQSILEGRPAQAGHAHGWIARSRRTLFPAKNRLENETWLNRMESEFVRASILQRASSLRRLIITVATVILVLSALTVFAFYQQGLAQEKARRAQAEQLAAQAQSAIERNRIALSQADPSLALLLATQAVQATLAQDHYVAANAQQALLDAVRAAPPWIRTLRGHADAVLWASFSSDSQRIVTASEDQTARVWNTADGRAVLNLPASSGVRHAAFSPDGTLIVTTNKEGVAHIWDSQTGNQRLQLSTPGTEIWSTNWSPDGRRLVTASKDGIPRIWNAETGQEIRRLTGHDGPVWTAVFSPTGDRVVTSSYDLTARIWNANTGEELFKLTGHEDELTSASFSPDGQRVVTSSYDETARVWDAHTGKPLLKLDHPGGIVYTAAFSPAAPGRHIVTASSDGVARIWDAVSGNELHQLTGHQEAVWAAAFSPAGDLVVTASGDGTARLWKSNNGQFLGHTGHILSAAFDPAGARVVTASGDFTAGIWDVATGERLIKFQGHDAWVNSGRFSPQGDRVVTASSDRTARIWDARTGEELFQLSSHTGDVNCAAFDSRGDRVITASSDGSAIIWDAGSGRELLKLHGNQGSLLAAAFTTDGRQALTGGEDGLVRLWDAVTGEELLTFRGHQAAVWSVNVSPDDRRLVTASQDGTARLWDLATGQELRSLAGHEGMVLFAAFSPDGSQVVTAGEDRTARTWDSATGEELFRITGHDDLLYSAVFSPDGKWILTASADWSARLWPSSLELLIGRAVSLVQRDPPVLTPAEEQRLGLK